MTVSWTKCLLGSYLQLKNDLFIHGPDFLINPFAIELNTVNLTLKTSNSFKVGLM